MCRDLYEKSEGLREVDVLIILCDRTVMKAYIRKDYFQSCISQNLCGEGVIPSISVIAAYPGKGSLKDRLRVASIVTLGSSPP